MTGDVNEEVAAASVVPEYEAKIAALERNVGQLTMKVDLLEKTPRLHLVMRQRELIDQGAALSPSA